MFEWESYFVVRQPNIRIESLALQIRNQEGRYSELYRISFFLQNIPIKNLNLGRIIRPRTLHFTPFPSDDSLSSIVAVQLSY
jgi:hypothetical protein